NGKVMLVIGFTVFQSYIIYFLKNMVHFGNYSVFSIRFCGLKQFRFFDRNLKILVPVNYEYRYFEFFDFLLRIIKHPTEHKRLYFLSENGCQIWIIIIRETIYPNIIERSSGIIDQSG